MFKSETWSICRLTAVFGLIVACCASCGDGVIYDDGAESSNEEYDISLLASASNEGGSRSYNTYFGSLHNHTSFSDGHGTPAEAYQWAKDHGIDFLGIADHSGSCKKCLTAEEWAATKTQADAATVEGFVAFRGFEWTSSKYGHVAVVNTDDYASANSKATNTFSELMTWLSKQKKDSIAMLNHPDKRSSGKEFSEFTDTPDKRVVGMELFNKGKDFSVYYYDTDSSDPHYCEGDDMTFFDEALSRGWKIGAAGGFDEHGKKWFFRIQPGYIG